MALGERPEGANPLPGIILVILMAVGAYWAQTVPLPSARPQEAVVAAERYAARQDIDARLWQDPFEAVKNAPATPAPATESLAVSGLAGRAAFQVRIDRPASPPSRESPACDTGLAGNGARVMAVLVNGAPYSEAAEDRRRTRYAVLSGLARRGFVPHDREHLGVVQARLAGRALAVPFEWYVRADGAAILLLWINEIPIRDRPLAGLRVLLDQSGACLAGRDTLLLGPSNSDTLRALLAELAPRPGGAGEASLADFVRRLRIHSPKATAPDEHLLRSAGWLAEGEGRPLCLDPRTTVAAQLARVHTGLEFQRSVPTDCALVFGLARELKLRGVDPDDGLVVISEWDTFYGRALRQAFEEALRQAPVPPPASRSTWIWHYSYLRGLDGKLPGESADRKSEAKEGRPAENVEVEAAYGNHQKDYLRRMATRMYDLDEQVKRAGHRSGIKAIGVLGSDVYDKLLILRALRPRFPEAIFFTTDLDARLLAPEEWATTRNLVVVSGYGLRLNGWLQWDIPPFRDTYQTAYFASTLAALEDAPAARRQAQEVLDRWSWSPRVFEVGREGAVDLSVAEYEPKPCDLASGSDGKRQCRSVHPHNPAPGPPEPGVWVLLAMPFLAGFWLHRRSLSASLGQARVLLERPPPWRSPRWTRSRIPLLALGTLLGLWLAWQGQRIWLDVFVSGPGGGGEPFAWYGGVSVWPSVLLRGFTGALALYLLLRGMQQLRRNDIAVTERFFSGQATTLLWRQRPSLGLRFWHACRRGRLCQAGLGRCLPRWLGGMRREYQSAAFIWRDAVQPRSRVALAGRLLAGAALLLTVAILIISLGEAPNTPARGETSFLVNRCVLIFALSSFALLLVFVIDSIRRAYFLASRLRRATRWPAALEQAQGCAGQGYCDDWLDMQLVVARTQVAGGFIYYPFIIMSLLLVARSTGFDNWQTPTGLALILAFYLALSLACAISLRNAAEKLRAHALENIERDIVTALGRDDLKPRVEQMKRMKDLIQAERRGAFSSFLNQPWLKAVLLSLGSYSGIQFIEYLSWLSL